MAREVGTSAASLASRNVISSTRDSRPMTSQRSWPSFRLSSDMRPAELICGVPRQLSFGLADSGACIHRGSAVIATRLPIPDTEIC